MAEVTYRWVDGWQATQPEWDAIEEVCAAKGWASLNRSTTRVLLAEANGMIVGFNVFQMFPYVGPLYVAPEMRGTGIAENLADGVLQFLTDVNVRGFMTVIESPHAARLCEARGMKLLTAPVYVKLPDQEGD